MIKITDKFIEEVSQKAKSSPRKRINYNFHKSYGEAVQRLLNAAEPGTYIQPHKHEKPDKAEVFIILKGRVVIVEFDEKGKVVDHVILDPKGGAKAVEVPPRVWHSFIALRPSSVLYEVKEGPYNETVDKRFASWAPEEGTKESQKFNGRIIKGLKIN